MKADTDKIIKLRRKWHDLDEKVDAISVTIDILNKDRERFRAEAVETWALMTAAAKEGE